MLGNNMTKRVCLYLLLSLLVCDLCQGYGLDSAIPKRVAKIKCGHDQVYTSDKGCINKCSSFGVQQCQNPFKYSILQIKKEVCGHDEVTGDWKTYKNKCSACKKSDGYVAGSCHEDLHEIIVVPVEDPVIDPILVVDGCKQNQIYTSSRGCITACSDPSFKRCPDVFAAIYDPKFCAFAKDGTWKSFTFQCQACPNSYPDTQYLGVSDGQCTAQELNILPDPIIPDPVESDQCAIDTDCYQQQNCQNGKCVNNCISILCAEKSQCIHGSCLPLAEENECSADHECKQQQVCRKGKCIRDRKRFRCGNKSCRQDQKCVYGLCIDVAPYHAPEDLHQRPGKCENCLSTQYCDTIRRKCVDKCSQIKCKYGSVCENGICVQTKDNCHSDGDCAEDQKCQGNACEPACSFVKCGFGRKCIHGACQWRDEDMDRIFCKDDRLRDKACPVYNNIRDGSSSCCIFDQDGKRRDFDRECLVCKDINISHYVKTDCHTKVY